MASSSLINPLPPGAIVRTDEGGDDVNPSDDVRLGFGKALLSKAEGADAATAGIIANAANAILGPIVRIDDGKEVDPPPNGERGGSQPMPPPKPGTSPLNRRNPAEKGGMLPTKTMAARKASPGRRRMMLTTSQPSRK